MSELLSKYDDLLKDSGPAAIVFKQWLKPVGSEVFFPPTYANPSQRKGDPPVYNIDRFESAKHSVCVIDSIPSQANRIEPSLGRVTDKEGKAIRLVPKVVVKTMVDGEEKQVNLLEAGHRAADAVVQLSSLREDITKAIKAYRDGDATRLAKLAPTSLVFGMWDSRKSGVKVPRLLNSIIRAYDVLEHRRSSQFNAALDFESAGVVPGKGDKKLSEVGMNGAPATFQHGGIEARGGICRDASLNLCTLRDIPGTDENQTLALQRYILGLSLVALTYFDGKIFNLRQGCQLVAIPEKPMTRTFINADGSETPFGDDAEGVLAYAASAAAAFGVDNDRIDEKFNPTLAKDELKKSTKDEEGGKS
ncbi:MAG: type I-U CRISPR-associated protein Cas7 [Blastocatellia bacterium AA13]|nr:MAG: type I-U CRISPR-associated protein Cas7 [Blastocatellia bacterium AA13]